MLRVSRLLLVSKKALRLKCSQCMRLLPADHFPHKQAPAHTLICLSCKRTCVMCGVRQTLDQFASEASNACNRCLAKEHVAKENVYFRFPTLKYRACPFNVDAMREVLDKERDQ